MTTLADTLSLARGPQLRNRLLLAPLTNLQSNPDGTLGEDEYRWLVLRARGGFAMTMTCAAHVQRGGQGFPGQLGIWSDIHLPGLARLADAISAEGSVAAVQLQHSGRRADPELTGEPRRAPWDDAETGATALSTGEVEQVVEDFAAAAARAEQAGFEGVELHGAHGYLLCQFLDAAHNHRADRYGGSFENRSRIYWEVIDAIRARTGPGFQLGLRLSPERYGYPLAEAQRVAEALMQSGKLDYLDMSLWSAFKLPDEEAHDDKPLIAHFTGLARGPTRLGVAGKIFSAATAQYCLDLGADFVMIGRAAILHQDFARRAIADAGFDSVPLPVSRAHLVREGLGPAFVDYMATWRNFVVETTEA